MALIPSPQTAAEIAGMILPWVQENYGATLDYSVDSLHQLDGIIDDLRRDQRFEVVQPLLFSMGCYLGEVLVRQAGASWRTTQEMGMPDMASSPIVIEMSDGRGFNPVAKAYKRFQSGSREGIARFFRSMSEATAGRQRPKK